MNMDIPSRFLISEPNPYILGKCYPPRPPWWSIKSNILSSVLMLFKTCKEQNVILHRFTSQTILILFIWLFLEKVWRIYSLKFFGNPLPHTKVGFLKNLLV